MTGPSEAGISLEIAEALKPKRPWLQPLDHMQPADVIEIGVDLEKLRRRTSLVWIQSFASAVAGAGLGALLSSGANKYAAIAALCLGGGLWVGLLFASRDRQVSTGNVCGRFLRILDRWPQMGEHQLEKNSDYIRAIVDEESPNLVAKLGIAKVAVGAVFSRSGPGDTGDNSATS